MLVLVLHAGRSIMVLQMKKVIKGQTRYLVLCVFFVLMAGVMGTAIQFFKGNLLDYALAGRSDASFKFGVILLVAIAIELVTYYGYYHFRSKFSVNNLRVMRNLFFKWLLGTEDD